MTSRNNKSKDNTASNGGSGLTLKKRLFAVAYHAEPNATQAAIRAGYSARTAQQAGSRLLKDAAVRAELARLASGGAKEKPQAAQTPDASSASAPKAEPTPQGLDAAGTTRRLLEQRGTADPAQPLLATTPTEEAFITEYMRNGMNGTAAWMFTHPGSTPDQASTNAAKWLRKGRVAARITAERSRLAAQHEMSRDQLLTEFLAIVRADPNELMQMRAVACSTCWGGDPTRKGRWVEPDPECQECMGDGHSVPWFSDTRKLSPEARALFAGVKLTKDGATILVHDKMAALVNIGKILGAYEKDNEQKRPELSEAIASFVGQLHKEGAGRLQFTPRQPGSTPPKVQH